MRMTEQSSGSPSRGRRRTTRRAPEVVEEQAAQEAPSPSPPQEDDFGAGVDDPVKPWDNHSDDFEPDLGGAEIDSSAPQGIDRPHYGGGDYDSGMPRRRRRRRRRRRP